MTTPTPETAAGAPQWQPIETAPKDKTRMLLACKSTVTIGSWNDDRYARKPRPYWTNDRERIFGILDTRSDQPTHWMLLPALPERKETP